MSATIKIEFMVGDTISDAFKEAQRIAIILGVIVNFKFNDVDCYARSWGNTETGVKQYREALKKKHKMAFN